MVGKNYLRAIADKQMSIHLHAHTAQAVHFLHKCERVQYHAIADNALATLAQYAAWDQLQDKLLSLDDHGVSGIVSAGIASHYVIGLREHVNDLALALIAPLRADNDCGIAFFHKVVSLRSCG